MKEKQITLTEETVLESKPDIRLLAIDLDETMLTAEKTITPRVKAAIRKARAQGIVVTIATGRMYVSALPYAKELDIDVPLITYQGALIITTEGQVLAHKTMSPDLSRELVAFLKPYGHHINLYMGDDMYIEKDSPEVRRYQEKTRICELRVIPDFQDFLAGQKEGATKFSLISTPEEVCRIIEEGRARFGGRMQFMPSQPHFLEFGRPDIGKGLALAEMAADMGITREQVMAIGDSPNDLDMIEYAGCGVVMANGLESVREKADYITADNDHDGVALAIEKLALK